jgi:hypothetical protein
MDNKGFIPDLYNSAVQFNSISMELFEMYRDLLGTEVTVTRVLDTESHKTVLSATLTSTFEDNDKTTHFKWKVVINMSQMMQVWRRNVNQLDIYDPIPKLKIGDLLEFEYLGVRYRFKVTQDQAYGIGQDIMHQYSMMPIVEHKI